MLPFILFTLISAFIVYYAIFYFSGNREIYKKIANIPGPRAIPLIGCVSIISSDPSRFAEQLLNLCLVYTSPFRVIIGTRVFVIFKDPDQIKTVLQSSKAAEKDYVYKFAKPWLGNGLVLADYKIWKAHRKLIQPTFNQQILQSFVTIFSKNALSLTQAVKEKVDGPEFELASNILFATFSNICESSMGISVETKRNELMEYFEATQRVLNFLFQRLIRIWLHSDTLFNLSELSRNFYDCIRPAHIFTDNVIREKKEYLQSVPIKNKEVEMGKRKPTLELLLELSDGECKLTDQDIRDEVLTVIFAGSDTTARTIDFLFLMLAIHPEIQDKVYEEIFNIYGSEDPEEIPVKWEDLPHLQYLERVIKETMRLFPAAPMVAREVLEDLEIDGFIIPKGCAVTASIIALHRDEKFWPDPLKFDPDRFLPEEVSKRHPFAHMPFMIGTRDCIGRVYAVMSMKAIVTTFLRKYVLIKDKKMTIKDLKLKTDALLRLADPVTVRLENRVK